MVEYISELPQFESLFGFSEEEIKVGLEQILLPSESSNDFIHLHLEVMKDNFNGYRFHPDQVKSVFNPPMCLYYMNPLRASSTSHLLDDNIADPTDNMTKFLVKSYRGSEEVIGKFERCTLGIYFMPILWVQLYWHSHSITDILLTTAHQKQITQGTSFRPTRCVPRNIFQCNILRIASCQR
jgi:hypothetical protein